MNGSDEVLAELRAVVLVNGSQKETARVWCISEQYLCDLLKGRRDITVGLAELLGFVHVESFVRREALSPVAGRSSCSGEQERIPAPGNKSIEGQNLELDQARDQEKEHGHTASRSELSSTMSEMRSILQSDRELREAVQAEQKDGGEATQAIQRLMEELANAKAEILRLRGAKNQECDPPVRIQGEIRRGENLGDQSRVVEGQPQASGPTGSTASSHEVK